MNASVTGATDRTQWEVTQCARVAAPPLRFSGRILDEYARDTRRVVLYERRKGGFVAAFPGFGDGQWRDHAMAGDDLRALMSGVETYFTRLSAPNSDRAPVGSDAENLADLLQALANFVAERALILDLVGAALARWTDLLPHDDNRDV